MTKSARDLKRQSTISKHQEKTFASTSDSNDLNSSGAVQIIKLGQTYINKTVSGFAENKFTYGGLLFCSGSPF